MFRIVRDHAVLETRYARIVDEHVDHRNDLRQALPIRLFADVEPFEPAAYRRRSLDAGGFVDVGEYDDGAFVVEALGDRAADAAGCAGYDADLHVQSWHLGLEM